MAAALVIVLAGAGLGLFVERGQPSRLAELLPDMRQRSATTRQLRLLVVVIGLVAAALVAPPLAAAAALWWWAHPRLARRRAALAATRAVESSLPDIVDLLALCTSAGWTLPLGLPLVARRASGPVPDALIEAMTSASRGRPLADSIADALAPLGERATALSHVLADHLRYGTPLGPGLERLALELRLHRRREAERRARRVPVRLLLPLVTCTLPAFALLTVVPLLVGSLEALSL